MLSYSVFLRYMYSCTILHQNQQNSENILLALASHLYGEISWMTLLGLSKLRKNALVSTNQSSVILPSSQAWPGVLGIRYLGCFIPRYSVFFGKNFRYRVFCITITLGICCQRFCNFKVYWYPRGTK